MDGLVGRLGSVTNWEEHIVDKQSGLNCDWLIRSKRLAYQSDYHTGGTFSRVQGPLGQGSEGLSGPSCWSAGGSQNNPPISMDRRISFYYEHVQAWSQPKCNPKINAVHPLLPRALQATGAFACAGYRTQAVLDHLLA